MKDILKILKILNDKSSVTYSFFLKKQLKCFVYMLVYIVSSVIFPGFVGKIIDEMNITLDYENILMKCFQMLLVGLIVIISNYYQRVQFATFGQNIAKELKEIIYKKVLTSNANFWKGYSVGDIIVIIEKDIEAIELFLSNTVLGIVTNLLLVIGLLSYICYINWLFGILLVMLAIAFCFIYINIGIKAKNCYNKLRALLGQFMSFVNETLNNVLSIQMAGDESTVFEMYKERNDKVISESIKQYKIIGMTNSTGILYNVISGFIVLVLGTWLSVNREISVGDVFNLILYTQRIYSPIQTITSHYLEGKKTIVILKKVVSLLENNDLMIDGNYNSTGLRDGNIKFSNVFFAYNTGENIISNMNYSIKKGDIVGVIGRNGSGKSTLLKLLTKICNVTQGSISIDGINVDDYSIGSLRKIISCLPQKPFFLSGRIRDIIDPYDNYTDQQIVEICNDFMFDIENLHEGLNTVIGENSVNLSGGEAQKVSFIRLLLENKQINLLDEPTSDMDIKSEKRICKILPKYLNGKTTIIVTHRQEILKICNKVYELKR